MGDRDEACVIVGVVGDRHERFTAQDTIETSLQHSADALKVSVEVQWFATPTLEREASERLAHVDSVWCAPGSPYLSVEGALEGIRFARESARPFLGTCASFQHGVIEYARNVLMIDNAHSAEYDRASHAPLIIDELLCSLVGRTMNVALVDELTRRIYGSSDATEQYYCRFGLNEDYLPALIEAGLIAAGVDQIDGTTRIMRVADHPFFFLTLFVPQASSTPKHPHPIISSYLAAAAERVRHQV